MEITKKQIFDWAKDERSLDLGIYFYDGSPELKGGNAADENFWKICDSSQREAALEDLEGYRKHVQEAVDFKLLYPKER